MKKKDQEAIAKLYLEDFQFPTPSGNEHIGSIIHNLNSINMELQSSDFEQKEEVIQHIDAALDILDVYLRNNYQDDD